MSASTALGHGVTIQHLMVDAEWYGVVWKHPAPDGGECSGGAVLFDVPANDGVPEDVKWTVEQRDPLTLSPSLLCGLCGFHGFIRGGRWVPA